MAVRRVGKARGGKKKTRSGVTRWKSSAWWKALPRSDRRFIVAMIMVTEAMGDPKPRYKAPPTGLARLASSGRTRTPSTCS